MAKASLLSKWLNRNNTSPPSKAAVAIADEAAGPFPLSYGQERLWVVAQTEPDNPSYNYAERYHVSGPLDPELLRMAFFDVAGREEMLRSTFAMGDNGPERIVGPEPLLEWKYEAAPRSGEAATAGMVAYARRPFDLERGPLTRVQLLRIDNLSHQLVVTQHHILTDKWSMHLFMEEVAQLYQGRQQGGAPTPDVPRTTYGAFARQQRGTQYEKSVAYWKEKLAAAPPVLDLPTDRPRPPHSAQRGGYASGELDPELSASVRRQARQAGTTPYTYLLSAYFLLLHRYSGQADLSVGTPVSNRDTLDLERLIGFFNETVVVRTQMEEGLTFSAFVQQVKQTVMEAFQHKNAPFDAIVRAVNPARRPGVNPLFQAMFILHQVPASLQLTSEVQLKTEPLDIGITKFDLTLFVADDDNHFTTIFEYATELFDRARIDRMLGQYSHLLKQVTRNPDLPLSQIDLVSSDELARLRAHPHPAPATRPSLDVQIARMAKARPQDVAVSAGFHRITYAELDRQATSLAKGLIHGGLAAGNVVGLHTPNGIQMITGILGILKAGGAYLPLDPKYPADRRRFMLADSGARWLVSDGPLTDFEPGADVAVLRLDSMEATDPLPEPVVEGRGPDDPAYLIYTSGSSGRPKGVMISHRNLFHSNAGRPLVYGESPTAFLLLSSFSFDSSVAGIFWTLSGGGQLVVAPERAEQDMDGLTRLMAREEVSHTLMLPSLYDALLSCTEPDRLQSLRTVIVAGETCTPATVERHFAQLPDVALYNEYGPTEATVWATVQRLEAKDAVNGVAIGRPVPYAAVYLVDAGGRLAPIGVPGEICIAGEGLAAGYWRRPELTADRFVYLELPDGSTERVYRTGDLGIHRADGTLHFAGRKDRQVKIRGYRVELGEIRQQLLREPGVAEAEVVVTPSGRSLVAYVAGETSPDTGALRQTLLGHLPEYMVPARIVRLEKLPRLPNGKVDVGALANPEETAEAVSSAEVVPPGSETEARLLEIWKRVLPVADFGVTDNFFTLGGDSILSIQLLSRARREGLEFAPTDLFERQTVRDLATVVRGVTEDQEAGHPAFSGAVGLTPIQQWFFAEHHTAPQHWNHAWRMELPNGTDPTVVSAIAESIVEHNEALRQQFVLENNQWRSEIRVYAPGRVFAQRPERGADIQSYLDGVQAGLDLATDPLFRACLFGGQAGEPFILVLLAHHLVVDMVSWEAILADFTAGLSGEQAGPHRHGAAYHRWPAQLNTWAEAGRFDSERSFWYRQAETPLDTDLPGALPVRQASVATITHQVDEATTLRFLREANAAYGTRPEELLLAALLRTLADHSGTDHHCLNLERHGREPLDSGLAIQETLGWFTVSYPLTFPVSAQQGPGEVIVVVKECLRAVPDNGIGYGVLRYLAGDPRLTQSPNVYFNYLGQRSAAGAAEFLNEGLRHPDGEVNRVWEINAHVEDSRLILNWSYSRDLHRPATVGPLLAATGRALQELVDHCCAVEEQVLTPSDFPDAGLSESDLEGLLGELNL